MKKTDAQLQEYNMRDVMLCISGDVVAILAIQADREGQSVKDYMVNVLTKKAIELIDQ